MIICFNCSTEINHNIYKAYDKNFCSKICRCDFITNYSLTLDCRIEKRSTIKDNKEIKNKIIYPITVSTSCLKLNDNSILQESLNKQESINKETHAYNEYIYKNIYNIFMISKFILKITFINLLIH